MESGRPETVLLRFDLERNSDALKALITHGVETCLRRGDECKDLVDRRLFGARPRGYGQWCLEMALAAEEGKAASFYLQELLGRVMNGARADGLTVEGARAGLAAEEALVNEFDEMVERRAGVESRTERRTPPAGTESPGDTVEQQAWQAQIAAQEPSLRAGRGTPQLLHQAAEVYLGVQENSAGEDAPAALGRSRWQPR